ncbi:hypothetical protein PORY_001043 [Pneumocystis oryctolagi]|uniref:Uncharacterized protein n=1 Tax=Pneumocystis oryctolagi TaxID=42067 RepID=A0ACB7CG17_9ASCO|nr:hypothetical protein PORY_001043 [Pneumocystis oryctolagi]
MFNHHDNNAFYRTSNYDFIENSPNPIPYNTNRNNYVKRKHYQDIYSSNDVLEEKCKCSTNLDISIPFNLQGKDQNVFFSLNTKENTMSLNFNQEFNDLQVPKKVLSKTSPDIELPFKSIISIPSESSKKNNIPRNFYSETIQLHSDTAPEKQDKFMKSKFQRFQPHYVTLDTENENNSYYDTFFVQEQCFSEPTLYKKFNVENHNIHKDSFELKEQSYRKNMENFYNIKDLEPYIQNSSSDSLFQGFSEIQVPYEFEKNKTIPNYLSKQTIKRSASIKRPKFFRNKNNDFTVMSPERHLQNTYMSSQRINMSECVFLDSKTIKGGQNYMEYTNFLDKFQDNKYNKEFLSNQISNQYYNNFNSIKHKKNKTIVCHSDGNYYKNKQLPPIPYKRSFKDYQLKYYNNISLSSNDKKLPYSLYNVPFFLGDSQIENSYKYIFDLSNFRDKIHDKINPVEKSPWRKFLNYENNKSYFNLKDKELERNKIENMDNNNLDIVKLSNDLEEFSTVQDKKLTHNPSFSKDNSTKRRNIANIFSSIFNYKQKLLNKKTYFSQVSKYFLIKYLKGKKPANGCYPDPLQFKSYYFTHFSVQFEHAIYHLTHLKLSDPRRPLYQQVLLINFIYNYLSLINKNQIMSEPENEFHQHNYSSNFKHNYIPEAMHSKFEKNTEFPIKKTYRNKPDKHLINDNINMEYETHSHYLIDSLDPTIFNYTDLDIPFIYNDYNDEFSNIYSVSHENDLYNHSVLNKDILDSNI